MAEAPKFANSTGKVLERSATHAAVGSSARESRYSLRLCVGKRRHTQRVQPRVLVRRCEGTLENHWNFDGLATFWNIVHQRRPEILGSGPLPSSWRLTSRKFSTLNVGQVKHVPFAEQIVGFRNDFIARRIPAKQL